MQYVYLNKQTPKLSEYVLKASAVKDSKGKGGQTYPRANFLFLNKSVKMMSFFYLCRLSSTSPLDAHKTAQRRDVYSPAHTDGIMDGHVSVLSVPISIHPSPTTGPGGVKVVFKKRWCSSAA